MFENWPTVPLKLKKLDGNGNKDADLSGAQFEITAVLKNGKIFTPISATTNRKGEIFLNIPVEITAFEGGFYSVYWTLKHYSIHH